MIPRPPNEQKAYQEGFQKALKLIAKNCEKIKWQKEFEDKLSFDSFDYFGVENKELGKLVMDFIGIYDTKVKIKCKDGCIQIERIK